MAQGGSTKQLKHKQTYKPTKQNASKTIMLNQHTQIILHHAHKTQGQTITIIICRDAMHVTTLRQLAQIECWAHWLYTIFTLRNAAREHGY